MCLCICELVYVCVCECVHACVHLLACPCLCVCMCVFACMSVCVCAYGGILSKGALYIIPLMIETDRDRQSVQAPYTPCMSPCLKHA